MVAEHRYAPRQSRAVSFGAALAINGVLIAGLIFAAPDFVKNPPLGPFVTKNIPLPPVEEVPPPKPQPRTPSDTRTMPRPNVPTAEVPTASTNTITTTDVMYPPLPPLDPPAPPGPPVIAEPPAPLPPLVAASQDMRFADAFQPPYPASELRAQRDGRVSIRILIGIDGRVKAVEPLSATSDAFFEATRRQALAKWRFKPATRGNIPEESWKVMSVRFEIANQ